MPAAVGHRRGHRASIHRGCAVFHTSKRRATPASTQPPHDPGSLLLPLKELRCDFVLVVAFLPYGFFFFHTPLLLHKLALSRRGCLRRFGGAGHNLSDGCSTVDKLRSCHFSGDGVFLQGVCTVRCSTVQYKHRESGRVTI
jgi:hypothetical protein